MAIFTAPAAETGDDPAAPRQSAPKPPVVAVSEAAVTAQKQYYAVALVLTAAGVIAGCVLMAMRHPDNALPQLAPGVGVFAVLYVFAQVIERLLEPVSPLLGGILGSAGKGRWNKQDVTRHRNKMLVEAMANPEKEIDPEKTDPEKTDLEKTDLEKTDLEKTDPKIKVKAAQACANAQYELDQFRENAAALAVGLATFLAALGAGFSGFLLLHMVGMTDTPIWLDLFVTGLAVGGGTKPLHDLITNITKSAADKQDPPQLQP